MASNNPRLTPEKTPRYFTSCDAARIARNVVNDRKLTPEQVLACVAKGLGFTHISLRSESQTVVESGVSLSKDVKKAGFDLIKIVLKSAKLVIPKRFSTLLGRIGAILEFLDRVERFLDRIFENPPQERVEDVLKDSDCRCKGDKENNTATVEVNNG